MSEKYIRRHKFSSKSKNQELFVHILEKICIKYLYYAMQYNEIVHFLLELMNVSAGQIMVKEMGAYETPSISI